MHAYGEGVYVYVMTTTQGAPVISLTADQLRAEQATTYAAMDRLYDEMTNLPYPSPAYTAKRAELNATRDRWNELQAERDRREAEATAYTPRHGLNWDAFDARDDGFYVLEAEANEAGK